MAAKKTGARKYPASGSIRAASPITTTLAPGAGATYTHQLGTRNLGLTGSVTQLDAYGAPVGRSAIIEFGSADTGIAATTGDNDVRFINASGWTLRVTATAFTLEA